MLIHLFLPTWVQTRWRRQSLDSLSSLITNYASVQREVTQETPLPTTLSDLEARQRDMAGTLSHTEKCLEQSVTELETANSDLVSHKANTLDNQNKLSVTKAERVTLQSRLDELIKDHGTREELKIKVEQIAQQHRLAKDNLKKLKDDRDNLKNDNNEQNSEDLDRQIKEMQLKVEKLLDRRGAAKQQCESISIEDPYAALEEARAQHDAAELDYQRLEQFTKAHKLLQTLFTEAQSDLSSRYSEPLANSISTFLKPLIPDGPVAQLSFDQTNGFSGLKLRRGGEFYDFHQLSGGMKEQLSAALRLSMADVLKGNYDECLPLMFDDAFTHSDPDRVPMIKQMLSVAVDRGLQVIFLTSGPAAYRNFADNVINF